MITYYAKSAYAYKACRRSIQIPDKFNEYSANLNHDAHENQDLKSSHAFGSLLYF